VFDLVIHPINSTYDQVACSESIARELYDLLSFKYPNYEKLRYKVKRFRYWDGSIHLFTLKGHRIYRGLRHELLKFANERAYTIKFIDNWSNDEFSLHEAESFIQTLNLPFAPYDYQVDAFVKAIRQKRLLILSPTSSGKSLMIYLIFRYWNEKSLFITPNTNLVDQIISDFKKYGYQEKIHPIYAGQDKVSNTKLSAATWQSIPVDENYLNQYKVILVDECHVAQAEILKSILENSTKVHKRLGFTGTLQDSPLHELVLQGLFGEIHRTTTTAELIKQGVTADLEIKCLILKHDPNEALAVNKLDYHEEEEFIVNHVKRKKFLYNLVKSLKGNVIVLFRLVDKHGKVIYDDLKSLLPKDRPVYMIYGGTDLDERARIRELLTANKNAVLVGSYGCLSQGFDAPSLQHVIFASAFKSKIKVLQSIGRGLRKFNDTKCIVYDIVDDFTYNDKQNYTLRHFVERVKLYINENFKYKMYSINVGENNNTNKETG